MELAFSPTAVDVAPAEYQRLLGYPRGRVLAGRAAELADAAREWYAAHGRPWVSARLVEKLAVVGDEVCIDGFRFDSPRLRRTLADSDAHAVFLVAVTAGHELEQQAQRLWREEKPDEYFFHEVFGSAVVERLVTTTGAQLCSWAEGQGMAVLPHDSPGYPEWDVGQQPKLLELIRSAWTAADRDRIACHESGMLRPKKSLLAVFGVTRRVDRVKSLRDLVPCEGCSFTPCVYRRAPYRRAEHTLRELPEAGDELGAAEGDEADAMNSNAVPAPLTPLAQYSTNRKALARWAANRLSLERDADGRVHARFRYEGTTCTNMGQTLLYDYSVTLGPRDAGYVIEEQQCRPAPSDRGHKFQCEYLAGPDALDAAIASEAPLRGQPLDAILSWRRPDSLAGCYCLAESREHKWGLVLETIHFALARQEKL